MRDVEGCGLRVAGYGLRVAGLRNAVIFNFVWTRIYRIYRIFLKAVKSPPAPPLRKGGEKPPPFIIVPYGDEGKNVIMLMNQIQIYGKRKEGVARLEFAINLILFPIWRFVLINNTSLQKWNRLAQKQLDQQFINKIISGLQCSPFEAQAILETVYSVYAPYFKTSGTLKPGQLLFQVVSIEAPSNTPLAECEQVTVVLTLDAGDEDLEVKQHLGVTGLRQHRIQRLAHEAFQQGGLLTVEDLANRLLNCGERTLSRDLSTLRSQSIVLPLRSTIKDMGRAISHRALIIQQWLQGKEYEQIKQITHHSIPSVQNYVSKFKRVVALAQQGFDINEISFLVKISTTLAEQYFRLYHDTPAVSHRIKELKSFLKKNTRISRQGRSL